MSPRGPGRNNRPLEERFWEKVDKSEGCWLWTACKMPSGHGQFVANNRRLSLAHRVAYEMFHGPIPEGLVIDHACHEPSCVRPSHLQAVTQALNLQNKRGASSNSATGVLGVSRCKQTGRYRVVVKEKHVGRYDTLAEAETAAIAARNKVFVNNLTDRQIERMEPKALLSERDILDALERAIAPLDDSASMLTLNDRLLDLLVDELVPDDDRLRQLGVDPWLLLLDLATPEAYELVVAIDDCDQAGHSWWNTLDQLSKMHDAKLANNPAERW